VRNFPPPFLRKFRPPFSIATYYLKNLILLQAFPNGNHRTAILAVEFFLKMNGHGLEYTLDQVLDFHKKSFTVQNRVYGSLEARGTSILSESHNEYNEFCKTFITEHLTKRD
jgi:prophage maintenance system killer protein